MDINTIIDRSRRILSSSPAVFLAYLFGSQVSNTTGPLSDVDLGIFFKDGRNPLERSAKLAYELGKELRSHRIDIVSLNAAPIELAYAIIAQGVCIYQRDNATRVEFEAQVLSMYGDYLPVLRSFKQEILGENSHDRRVQRYRETLRRTERTLSQISSSQG